MRSGINEDVNRTRAARGLPGIGVVLLIVLVVAFAPAAQEPQPPKEEPAADRSAPRGLARGRKLVLKDGSFQLARDVERKGDRVRYYSVERSAWEEIPAALVDWEATERAAEEEARQQQEARERIRELRAEELAVTINVDASIELAPGVFLPEGDGVFVFEGGVVRAMEQTLAETRTDKGRVLTQIFIPVPVAGRHRIEVPGTRAGFRVRSATVEFYMRTADRREPEVEIVRAEVRRNARRIEHVSTPPAGESWSERNTIPMQRWEIARGVYRFTPSQALEPGEYALVELVPGQGTNLYVWDFGVDPPGGVQEKKK
jgi:hypothetical protein